LECLLRVKYFASPRSYPRLLSCFICKLQLIIGFRYHVTLRLRLKFCTLFIINITLYVYYYFNVSCMYMRLGIAYLSRGLRGVGRPVENLMTFWVVNCILMGRVTVIVRLRVIGYPYPPESRLSIQSLPPPSERWHKLTYLVLKGRKTLKMPQLRRPQSCASFFTNSSFSSHPLTIHSSQVLQPLHLFLCLY
jgi:hypothetical protein